MGTTRQQPQRTRNPGTGIGALDQYLSSINEAFLGGAEGIYNGAAEITDPLVELAYRQLYGAAAADQLVANARAQRQGAADAVSRTFVSRPSPQARTIGQIGGLFALPVPRSGNWLGQLVRMAPMVDGQRHLPPRGSR